MNNHLNKQANSNLHFVVVPLMAQGHMMPMADLALLLAHRGARVSLITTPVNARRFRSIAQHATDTNLALTLVELPFPCAATGLPDGCENADLVPSLDLFPAFFATLRLMAEPLKSYLRAQPPSPTCIVSDNCMAWTRDVADDLSIPRLVFHGPSCFFQLITRKIAEHGLYEKVVDDREIFVVPGVPQRIEVNKLTAQRFFDWPVMVHVMREVEEAENASHGIVLNTFYELEPWYVDEYRRSVGKPVWVVGPVSVVHDDVGGKAMRGNCDVEFDYSNVLRWLEGREKGSVVFISFGSIVRTRMDQLVEIGCGLETSGHAFVWAVKDEDDDEEAKKWMAEFEERNLDNGIVMKGWVPQVLILTHPAVGGIMTHCGWNSTLEAVAAGVPMITWPHFVDQFLNEKLVVEVVGTGVGVGAKLPGFFHEAKVEEALVGREMVEAAVRDVMCDGEKRDRIRKRAKELGEKAIKAMEEGGSSYTNLSDLIDYAMELAESRRR